MRYQSGVDGRMLRRASLGPVRASMQRRYALMIPGRGEDSHSARVSLHGFGATSMAPPTGKGAGAGAEIGASQGAAIGSTFGPIGTAIGAVIGAIGGAIAGSINKKDPEQYNFDQAVSLWQQNPDAVYNIGNKYLPLAGLFDLHLNGPHIPIYLQYGRMGEQRFVNDMVTKIYQAGQAGLITAQDTALTVMAKVVQPWIDSWGKGPMVDPHSDLINRLMIGMILDYVTGSWRHSWFDVKGNFPFNNLPDFVLQTPAPSPAASPTASPTPSPVPTVTATAGATLRPGTNQAPLNTSVGQFTYDAGRLAWLKDGSIVGYVPANGNAGITSLFVDSQGRVIANYSNGGTLYWSTDAGWWLPLTAAGTGNSDTLASGGGAPATQAAPATPAVSNTPPAIGASISYALDSATGQMLQLPAGAVYGGLDSSGHWLVVYPSGPNQGQYSLVNGTLTPVSSAAMPPGFTAMPTYQAPSDTSGGGGGGGGGGGFFPGYTPPTYTPTYPVPASDVTDSNVASGLDNRWLILAAVGIAILLQKG